MEKYEQFDISGDVGLRVRGKALDELFENAGLGMSGLITDIAGIRETEKKQVVLSSDTTEELFILWLNELIFYFDTHGFVGTSFHVTLRNRTLTASVSGGTFDPEINEGKLLLKAATYHDLSLEKTDEGWEASVIFDI